MAIDGKHYFNPAHVQYMRVGTLNNGTERGGKIRLCINFVSREMEYLLLDTEEDAHRVAREIMRGEHWEGNPKPRHNTGPR